MCLEMRGGEVGMDRLASRGCKVKCSTTELHSPKRSPDWLIAWEHLFLGMLEKGPYVKQKLPGTLSFGICGE